MTGFTCSRCGRPTPDVDPDGRCLDCPPVDSEPHRPVFRGSYVCEVCGRYASDRIHDTTRKST